MNILELIKDCEVEWKSLGEVAKYVRGLTYNKTNESDEKAGGYYVLRANNITLSNNQLNFDDVKLVKFDTKTKPEQKLYKDDILISAASGSKEHVGKVAFISENMDFYFGGFMGVVRCSQEILPRFLFHILTSSLFKTYLNEVLNSSTINNLNAKVMNEFQIPIPPLEIQEKIVKILDKFTELEATLEATLEAELSLRVKQYDYYRDDLLNFGDDVEWKMLGEVCVRIFSGKNKIKNNEGKYNVYGSTGIIAKTDKKIYEEDLLLIARVGANAGFVHIATGEYDVSDNTLIIKHKEDLVILKYLYYVLENMNLNRFANGAGQPLITAGQLKELKILLPPLSTQQKIVEILDKFDRLTNSISDGLPKEIELRRKQYEYYRERLLNFPKSE
ncbi:type I restriction enzyme EcoR124II specificity protein [Actinobacillus pleuropneumoniae]|uniref:restriction endonuclease subunit S n=1 Tax=Actinobacillus pleuropneumoniae TaxID=715 RepID=UPI0001E4A3CF|nr:restriction endonuclease subunit S [Actinobacillus pleuropneumoniae]EFM90567.1 Possible type I site-specific deoxyribonuclease [Actinobacillus pleuropneumoniae serovar 4 str. M62]UKH40510.1 restriction endonuclease subunit S [Actinobacillus pleuropneumoniae serovar 4 str. M62]SQF64017.1 type I restriction enzyme EcoR124II specificity protein [Actinobacillus pleuropneumoniae]